MTALLLLGLTAAVGAGMVFRPLRRRARPAAMPRLDPRDGRLEPHDALPPPRNVYAFRHTYAAHINAAGRPFDARALPTVLAKSPGAWLPPPGREVVLPDAAALAAALDAIEPGLGARTLVRHPGLVALLDYEVELALVVLEELRYGALLDERTVPRYGFLLANDVTARTVELIGEGRPNELAFASAARGFAGFLPTGGEVWVPRAPVPDGVLDVELRTRVNGELRQQARATELVMSPRALLRHAARAAADGTLHRGDLVLTGTPGGVALAAPVWKRQLADLLLARDEKIEALLAAQTARSPFLKVGDTVTVEADGLGAREIVVAARR